MSENTPFALHWTLNTCLIGPTPSGPCLLHTATANGKMAVHVHEAGVLQVIGVQAEWTQQVFGRLPCITFHSLS